MAESKTRQLSSRFLEMFARTIDDELSIRLMVTSNRHRLGKTNSMIRIAEKVNEEILGRKFHIDDLTLTCLEYMRRARAVPQWTPVSLDEPERPIGNKSQWDAEANAFTEYLMTSPWQNVPFFCALPHGHFLSLSVYTLLTSQLVKHSRNFCEVFELERDQLNRRADTFTWSRGTFEIGPAYSWDWLKYLEKREAFDTKRGKILEDRIASLHEAGRQLSKEDVYRLVLADPKTYTDKDKGRVTSAVVESKIEGISFAESRYAANKYNRLMRDKELAEADKVADSDPNVL